MLLQVALIMDELMTQSAGGGHDNVGNSFEL